MRVENSTRENTYGFDDEHKVRQPYELLDGGHTGEKKLSRKEKETPDAKRSLRIRGTSKRVRRQIRPCQNA